MERLAGIIEDLEYSDNVPDKEGAVIRHLVWLASRKRQMSGGARWMNQVGAARWLSCNGSSLQLLNDLTIVLNNSSYLGVPHHLMDDMTLEEVHNNTPNSLHAGAHLLQRLEYIRRLRTDAAVVDKRA